MTDAAPAHSGTHGDAGRSGARLLAALADFAHQTERTEHAERDLDIVTTATAPVADRSSWQATGAPLAVIRAFTARGVARVLALATEYGVPVATRGAGSGLAGGSAAGSGWIVLDVSPLDRIVRIDPVDQLAIVQPGVSPVALNAAAAEYGLRYAPDPASAAISSIGGNIATNAGGFRAVKYGVTRDAVRSLTVVTGDGRTLRTGSVTAKGVVGYDLVSLLTGSEGTLGVVTEATVALQPIPRDTVTIAAYFPSIQAAAEASIAVLGSDVTPSLYELLDRATLEAIDAVEGTSFSERGSAFVIVQTDGWGAAAEADRITELLTPFASELSVAADEAEAEQLIRARRLALPALERLGRVLIEDIAVPISRLAQAVERIGEIAAETGTRIFTLGHAGDGNLHPIVLVPAHDDPAQQARFEADAQAAADAIFALAIEFGGTVSGEHGVGIVKQEWSAQELGEVAVHLHAGIKHVFDPAGILNPGKGF
ncbi:FAD-binding oxidoreductase [Leucobacter musarum]|uniref:FAD-binding oxidoreductase n=1 Tax=Leucobacter musarum TaxID=1930747 RepID=UPI0009E76754|nr:FAD-linked oxidase C-terminal domain-containing protein [Leucobacter musarum]